MKRILIYIVLFYAVRAEAQYIKTLGSGLNSEPYCIASDSTGNIYAVTGNDKDSIVIKQWRIIDRQWKDFTVLKVNFSLHLARSMALAFINGEMFLSYRNGYEVVTMKYFSGNWSLQDKILTQPDGGDITVNSIVFKKRLYLMGPLDSSFNNADKTRHVAVRDADSGGYVASGFPKAWHNNLYFQISADTLKDTLYMVLNDKIVYHVAPAEWGVYYTLPPYYQWSYYKSIAVANGKLYVALRDSLFVIKNRKVLEKYSTGNYRSILCSDGQRLIVKGESGLLRYSETAGPLFFQNLVKNETNFDTSDMSFYKSAISRIYYSGSNGVFLNGKSFNYIAEFLPDSLQPTGTDTVLIKVFRDKNRNLVLDQADGRAWASVTGDYMQNQTDSTGEIVYYQLENENRKYRFLYENNYDTCYKSPYPGGHYSKTFNSPRTRDTVYMPLWRTAKSSNTRVSFFGRFQARLLDTVYLGIRLENINCDNSKVSGAVTLNLQNGFTFISSTPPPDGRNGNTLTYYYSNLTNYFTGYLPQIKVKGIYDNNKFKIGDKCSHTVRMTNYAREDDTTDNYGVVKQELVYSYDPNTKQSDPQGRVTEEVKKISYRIDFQNEGNDFARTVTVVDTLDTKLHALHYRYLGSSHECEVYQTGNNVVTWVFSNINLAPKNENDAGSKGYVSFEVYVHKKLAVGDSIRNKAYIYFDYNEPVITPFAVVQRDKDNAVIKKGGVSCMIVFPNPAVKNLKVEGLLTAITQHISVYNSTGQLVTEKDINGKELLSIDCSSWAPGIYLVVSDMGQTIKLVIE